MEWIDPSKNKASQALASVAKRAQGSFHCMLTACNRRNTVGQLPNITMILLQMTPWPQRRSLEPRSSTTLACEINFENSTAFEISALIQNNISGV